jgi:hypothetical protein
MVVWWSTPTGEHPLTDETLASGSSHYRCLKIQPLEYIRANKMGYVEGNIIKYVSRYINSGTPRTDLEKAMHYLQVLLDDCPPDEITQEQRRRTHHTPPPLVPHTP